MTKKKTPVNSDITYIMDLIGGGQRKVTVPANWKPTFGPTIPFTKDGRMASREQGGYALRFYAGSKENLRMIFTDVATFRDSSIVIEEKVTKVEEQTVRKQTAAGAKDFVIQAKHTSWVDPDAPVVPEQEFLTMPKLADLRDAEDA